MPSADKSDIFKGYGYLSAQTLVQVLKQCGDDLSRENIRKQAESLHDVHLGMLLPKIVLSTSPTNHLAIKQLHRSEEHTSELQSLMRISYAVSCLQHKNRLLRTRPLESVGRERTSTNLQSIHSYAHSMT